MSILPFPVGETILLSAGPRAGKSTLLASWRSLLPGPVAHLALTPEDAEPEFFRYRLLLPWPAIRERFDDLSARFSASWGAILGRAIAEAHPDFTLLLDDLHVIEATPILPELLALFRHFSPGGGLAIASRHQVPSIQGRASSVIGPDHPYWQERPGVEDLLGLPMDLQSEALVLHLLGESVPGPEGRELLRRNIARLDEHARLQLREPWQKPAEAVLAMAPDEGLWERFEQPIEAFRKVCYRGLGEHRIQRVLDKIPTALRERHPYFLQLQGDLRFDLGQVERARIYYQQALGRIHDEPERELNLLIRLMWVTIRFPALDECRALLDRIERLAIAPPLLEKARIGILKGVVHRYAGESEAARAAFLEVAGLPTSGDRRIAYECLNALSFLGKIHSENGEESQADHYLNQAVAVATEYGLHRDLLAVRMARLAHQQSVDVARVFPIQQICDLPNECFGYLPPSATFNLLFTLALRAYYLGEGSLAERYYTWAKQWAQTQDLLVSVHDANLGLMNAYRLLGRHEEARRIYEELRQSPFFDRFHFFVQVSWALVLLDSGQFQAAEAFVEEELTCPHPEPILAQLRFYGHVARFLQGDAPALEAIRAFLDSAHGELVWRQEARLLQRLGLRCLPPLFRIRGFGPLSFHRDDQVSHGWARKKPLSLLGHMVLRPKGIASEELAGALFGDPEDLESLHTAAYRLRQGLKELDGSDLLESLRGTYRLQWDRIAYCDVHEFDALYHKAQSLETDGYFQAAALFYGLALRIAEGPLFENLPKEFGEVRAAYVQRCQYAQDFVQDRLAKIAPPVVG